MVLGVWPHPGHRYSYSTQICCHCHPSSQVKDAPRKWELTYMILRYVLILIKTRGFTHADLSTCKSVLDRCYLGDWFVLYQLSKKSNITSLDISSIKHLEKSLYSKVNLTYECKPMRCLMYCSQSLTSQASEEEVFQNIQKEEGSYKENEFIQLIQTLIHFGISIVWCFLTFD